MSLEHEALVFFGIISGTGVGIGLMFRWLNQKIDRVDDRKIDKEFCGEHIKSMDKIAETLKNVPETLATVVESIEWLKKKNGFTKRTTDSD